MKMNSRLKGIQTLISLPLQIKLRESGSAVKQIKSISTPITYYSYYILLLQLFRPFITSSYIYPLIKPSHIFTIHDSSKFYSE